MDSAFPWACRLLPESVFHFSTRSLAKSNCAACETDSRSASSALSWLTEAYETGPCDAGGSEEITWALTARQSGSRERYRKRKMKFRFIKFAANRHQDTKFSGFRKIYGSLQMPTMANGFDYR